MKAIPLIVLAVCIGLVVWMYIPHTQPKVVEVPVSVGQVSVSDPQIDDSKPAVKITKDMFLIPANTRYVFNQPLEHPADCYLADGRHYGVMGGHTRVYYKEDLYCTR